MLFASSRSHQRKETTKAVGDSDQPVSADDVTGDSQSDFTNFTSSVAVLGDTELIALIRALLSNTNYVYHSPLFSTEVEAIMESMRRLIAKREQSIINMACTVDGNTALHVACAIVTPLPKGMMQRQLEDSSSFTRHFHVRDEVIRLLLTAGANPFVANIAGLNTIEVCPEGAYRESYVGLLGQYRASTEGLVKSVAPCEASRLLKRAKGDSGYAVFSSICRHCVYELYKGGVYLWDIKSDVAHVLYQPRDQDVVMRMLERRLSGFDVRRKKSIKGFAFGAGKWTSSRLKSAIKEFVNPEEEKEILNGIREIESRLPLVNNFVVTTGVEVRSDVPIPKDGGIEWILCNTGAVIGVRLNREGIMLKEGTVDLSSLQGPTMLCGAAPKYPENQAPDIKVFDNSILHFAKRSMGNLVCCAVDGLRRKMAYVLPNSYPAFSRSGSSYASSSFSDQRQLNEYKCFSPTQAPAVTVEDEEKFSGNFLPPQADGTSPLIKARKLRNPDRLSLTDASENSVSSLATTGRMFNLISPKERLFAGEGREVVFRVANLSDPKRSPKPRLEDVFEGLTGAHGDPFELEGAFTHSDYAVSGNFGEATAVAQCGEDVFILFCTNGVVIANAIDEVGKPPVTFTTVTDRLRPEGVITNGISTVPQRFHQIKPSNQKRMFVVQSNVIELFELTVDHRHIVEITPILRIPPDRVTPHRYTPLFHSNSAELIVMYQSLKRTEVCSYDFTTGMFQSLCKLPKPSSLQFFPVKKDGLQKAAISELPVSIFALSLPDEECLLLRYNVTMHVISVYNWREILEKSAEKKIKKIFSVFCRDSCDATPTSPWELLKKQYAYTTNHPARPITSYSCSWVVIECGMLQSIQAKHRLTARVRSILTGRQGSPERPLLHPPSVVSIVTPPDFDSFRPALMLCQDIVRGIDKLFHKVVIGESGRMVPYEPPAFLPGPEDEVRNFDRDEKNYYLDRPWHEGVWAAYFNEPTHALSCALNMLNEMVMSKDWKEETRRRPECDEFTPLHDECYDSLCHSTLSVVSPEKGTRTPMVRALVCNASTTSPISDLVIKHRMATEVLTEAVRTRLGAPSATPVTADGIVIIPTAAFKSIKPLLSLVCKQDVVSAKIPPPVYYNVNKTPYVKLSSPETSKHNGKTVGGTHEDPTAEIVEDLTALVTKNLEYRLKSYL